VDGQGGSGFRPNGEKYLFEVLVTGLTGLQVDTAKDETSEQLKTIQSTGDLADQAAVKDLQKRKLIQPK
jgi:hypothetical protein